MARRPRISEKMIDHGNFVIYLEFAVAKACRMAECLVHSSSVGTNADRRSMVPGLLRSRLDPRITPSRVLREKQLL